MQPNINEIERMVTTFKQMDMVFYYLDVIMDSVFPLPKTFFEVSKE